jgi:hypothetical protein
MTTGRPLRYLVWFVYGRVQASVGFDSHCIGTLEVPLSASPAAPKLLSADCIQSGLCWTAPQACCIYSAVRHTDKEAVVARG